MRKLQGVILESISTVTEDDEGDSTLTNDQLDKLEKIAYLNNATIDYNDSNLIKITYDDKSTDSLDISELSSQEVTKQLQKKLLDHKYSKEN